MLHRQHPSYGAGTQLRILAKWKQKCKIFFHLFFNQSWRAPRQRNHDALVYLFASEFTNKWNKLFSLAWVQEEDLALPVILEILHTWAELSSLWVLKVPNPSGSQWDLNAFSSVENQVTRSSGNASVWQEIICMKLCKEYVCLMFHKIVPSFHHSIPINRNVFMNKFANLHMCMWMYFTFQCIPTRSAFALGGPGIYSSRCSCKIHLPSGLTESQGNKDPNKYLCFMKEWILYLYCPCMLSRDMTMESTEGFRAAKHTWISKHLFLHSVILSDSFWNGGHVMKDEVTSCPL